MDLTALEHAVDELSERVTSLRGARSAYPDEQGPTLEAALAELDTATELLLSARTALRQAPGRQGRKGGSGTQRELKLLRQVFRAFPVPVIVMDGGGVVRRINGETGKLLGSPDGYLVGRPFPLLVDLSRRAAFRSHLTSVLQTGQTAAFETRLSHQGRTHVIQLALTRLSMPGEPQQMVAAVALPMDVQPPNPATPHPGQSDGALLMLAARRQDLLARMAALLLDPDSLQKPLALPRAARLLAADWADWVVADVTHEGTMRRSIVLPPREQPFGAVVRLLEQAEPMAAPVVAQVFSQATGVAHEMVEDDLLLGLSDGGPLLASMGAGSLLSVPISGHGVLTLVRLHDRPPFTLADLGLIQEVGAQLGLALQALHSFQSRTQATEALTQSVAPRHLPDVPGFEAAAIYHPGSSVGAEFYDVFPVSCGWGFALGGAAGKGEEAASVTAMVRGGLRVLSTWESDPDQVMRKVNQALVAQGTGMFVMAVAGFVQGDTIRLSSAGHHPAALVQRDGGVRFASGGGVPLGIAAEAETRAEEVTLAPEQTLVFYSEGLISSRNRSGETYGEDRLADVLGKCAGQPPAAVVKAVEDDRHAFSEGQVWDEVVVLALRSV